MCKYSRASRHKNFKNWAAFSYCTAKDENYYGFKSNVISIDEGIIVDFNLAPSNLDEREALFEMSDSINGLSIADKCYIDKEWKEIFKKKNIDLQTPVR